MAKVKTTVMIEERLLRAVRAKAARTSRNESDVIEEALRRQLVLDLLERLDGEGTLDEDAAMNLAVEAQHEARHKRT